MKFSVITPSLNQGRYIKDCIDSVIEQDHKDIEHIIIDGGSSDETLSLLKNYRHLKIISEKDSGPANAINKGFKIASGEILSWLNADDYYESNIFGTVNRIFEESPGIKFLYGNLTFVDNEKNLIFRDKSKPFDNHSLINISPDIRQPCTFFRKEIAYEAGYLDEKIKIVFDYDFFIKMTRLTDPYYIDMNLSYYRDYPETLTMANIRKQGFEIYKVSHSHGAKLFSPITKIALKRMINGRL